MDLELKNTFIEKLIKKPIKKLLAVGLITLGSGILLFMITLFLNLLVRNFVSENSSSSSIAPLFLFFMEELKEYGIYMLFFFSAITPLAGIICTIVALIKWYAPIRHRKLYRHLCMLDDSENIFYYINEEYDEGRGVIVETAHSLILPTYAFNSDFCCFTEDIVSITFHPYRLRSLISYSFGIARQSTLHLLCKLESGQTFSINAPNLSETYQILNQLQYCFPHIEFILK